MGRYQTLNLHIFCSIRSVVLTSWNFVAGHTLAIFIVRLYKNIWKFVTSHFTTINSYSRSQILCFFWSRGISWWNTSGESRGGIRTPLSDLRGLLLSPFSIIHSKTIWVVSENSLHDKVSPHNNFYGPPIIFCKWLKEWFSFNLVLFFCLKIIYQTAFDKFEVCQYLPSRLDAGDRSVVEDKNFFKTKHMQKKFSAQ